MVEKIFGKDAVSFVKRVGRMDVVFFVFVFVSRKWVCVFDVRGLDVFFVMMLFIL